MPQSTRIRCSLGRGSRGIRVAALEQEETESCECVHFAIRVGNEVLSWVADLHGSLSWKFWCSWKYELQEVLEDV